MIAVFWFRFRERGLKSTRFVQVINCILKYKDMKLLVIILYQPWAAGHNRYWLKMIHIGDSFHRLYRWTPRNLQIPMQSNPVFYSWDTGRHRALFRWFKCPKILQRVCIFGAADLQSTGHFCWSTGRLEQWHRGTATSLSYRLKTASIALAKGKICLWNNSR